MDLLLQPLLFANGCLLNPLRALALLKMWAIAAFLAVAQFLGLTHGATAPSGFPLTGNGLWYDSPGAIWSKDLLPIGNGYLAAMIPGGTNHEVTQLNIESLWSGGPFADPAYNGGNKQPIDQLSTAQSMQRIRQAIFQSPIGEVENIEELATDAGEYGSYAGAGYLVSNLNASGPVDSYARWLDLDEGVSRTTWTQSGRSYLRTTFCSHPAQSCTQHITTSTSGFLSRPTTLPTLTFAFSSALEAGLPPPNVTCFSPNSLLVRGYVSASIGPPSMLYSFIFHVSAPPSSASASSNIRCTPFPVPFGFPPNATITVDPGTAKEAWVTWVGGTEYDMNTGDEQHAFTFRGPDPHDSLVALLQPSAASPGVEELLNQHIQDYKETLIEPFSLTLSPPTPGSAKRPFDVSTNVLKSNYAIDALSGSDKDVVATNVYLEWLLFNYGRYMLMSSARGAFPANLQGKWADGLGNAWSADYHSNINIQMNYWAAEMTNLDVTKSLFDYFEKTWAPRGAFTAKVLYNITRGWVTHNEMNIFGHTGMKGGGNTAEWANYPESAVWMMIHVWDHFDYTNDVSWWKSQGWPLLKGAASFQLDKLIPDLHFNDSSLVVSPCNSPEQAPITFGCAHAQQIIWQMFNAVEKGFEAAGDGDTAFLAEVRSKRAQMDKGLHIGSWGQLQEWKVDKDSPADTHRHLSHLIGLYPGYAIASYDPALQSQPQSSSSPSNTRANAMNRRGSEQNGTQSYTKEQILAASSVSLTHRGNGTGPDADSGWEKVWRAATWAQLGDAQNFYHELSYAISENFGPNLFSLYNPFNPDPIFQIDANLGYPAAVINALLQAPDVPTLSTPLTITLLPALPVHWDSGSIRGARVRGGIIVDLSWAHRKPTSASFSVSSVQPPTSQSQGVVSNGGRQVRVMYDGRLVSSFVSQAGAKVGIVRF